MTFQLKEHQSAAIAKLQTGKVLVGGVGSGKTITSLAYSAEKFPDKRIIVITTAKKRDTGEWFADALKMSLRVDVHVDSWNNIKQYTDVEGASFIFDEQKLVGSGAWVDAFLEIAKKNEWILLSATPAEHWVDLVPVFLANGFYKNKSEFNRQHVVFSRYTKYPKIERYVEPWILERHRDRIYVEMPYEKPGIRVEHIVDVSFDRDVELKLYRDRWNIEEQCPIKDAGELMRLMRKFCNAHPSRLEAIEDIAADNPRLIIFYNHNYELEILRTLHSKLDIPIAEWNGKYHQDIPTGDRWIYLVQYQAGSEGWNCITTDTIVFYSLPYSFKNYEQAKGRIDRMNTKFTHLHYYVLKSRSIIDQSIWRALTRKKNFHASAFAKKAWPTERTLMRIA